MAARKENPTITAEIMTNCFLGDDDSCTCMHREGKRVRGGHVCDTLPGHRGDGLCFPGKAEQVEGRM